MVTRRYRFIREFANYKKELIGRSDMSDMLKLECCLRIDRSVRMQEQGLLTVNEVMTIIATE